MDKKEICLKVLKRIRDDEAYRLPNKGICESLDFCVRKIFPLHDWGIRYKASEVFEELYDRWPKSSGDAIFPIPSCDDVNSPETAFHMSATFCKMWDRSTEYGKLRWELLEWAISELEASVPQPPEAAEASS